MYLMMVLFLKLMLINLDFIKIEEIEFIENLIKDYGFDNSKNSIWYKLRRYYYNNKEDSEITDLINRISNNLNKEPFESNL